MASLYRRGKSKIWCVGYLSNGKRIVKSFKTTDEKIARLLKKEIEIKLRRGTHQDGRQIVVEAYMQEYVKDTTYRKKTTNRNEMYAIRDFLRATNKKTINGINQEDVRVFLRDYEQKAPKTYNFVLGAIKRFFRPAIEKSYILKNPCAGIKLRRLPQILPHFFTDEEYMRIEGAAEGEPIYPMIVTARYTGLRLRELIHLEWQDFDWEKKLLRVINKPKYDHTVKNFQVRIVPVSDELKDKLLPYMKKDDLCFPVFNTGAKYSDWGPKRGLKTVFKRAGIKEQKRLGWHEFRHTFASRLVQNNVPIYKISKWLGHSDLSVTQIYAHFAPVYDQDIEKLKVGDPVLIATSQFRNTLK